MQTLEQKQIRRKPPQSAMAGFEPVSAIIPGVLNGIAHRAARWDFFAAAALTGLLAKHGGDENESRIDIDSMVGIAARAADSLIELTYEAGR